MPILKSPLTLLGFLALALGVLQLVPLPPALARQALAGRAGDLFASGRDPEAGAGRPAVGPSSVEPAAGPLAGDARSRRDPALAGRCGRLPGDLLGRLAFRRSTEPALPGLGKRGGGLLLNAALGLVQIAGQAGGLYGFLQPGKAPIWAPSLDDLLETPVDGGLAPAGRLARPRRPRLRHSSGSRWSPSSRSCSGR